MPKKETKAKKPEKKERVEVPPDAFDAPVGTKVLIAETKEKESQDTSKKASNDSQVVSEKVEKEKDKDQEESIEKEAKDEDVVEKDIADKPEGVAEDQKEEDVEESEEDEPQEEKDVSFYEKVLGEKPPERVDDEEIEEQKEGLNRSLFFLGGVVFVLTVIVASSIGYLMLGGINPVPSGEVVEETPTPTPTPTPVEIDKESITFEILNGSGQGGVAGRTAEAIAALGYTADEVGNADSSDYSGITVGFSDTVEDGEKEVILEDLDKEFLGVEEDEELEPETTDVVVIVGR